jgi:O-antigen ligase
VNSRIVVLRNILKSKFIFVLVACLIPVALFLKAGFVSVSIIWFFTLSLYNFIYPITTNRPNFKSFLLFPIGIFVLYLIWVGQSDQPDVAFSMIAKKVHLLLIPLGFILAAKKISNRELQTVHAIFLAGCLVCGLICLIAALLNSIKAGSINSPVPGGGSFFFSYALTRPVGIEPIYLSLFSSYAFLVALSSPLIERKPIKIFLSIFLGIFVVAMGTKAGIGALITIILMEAIRRLSWRKQGYALLCVLLAISSIVLLVVQDLRPGLSDSLSFRYDQEGQLSTEKISYLDLWSYTREAIAKRPFAGYGPASGQEALEDVYRDHNFEPGFRDELNPHNQFLAMFLDCGVAGLLILIMMFVFGFIRSIRQDNVVLIGFLYMMSIYFFTECILERQKGIVFFAFFYAILWYVNSDAESEKDTTQLSSTPLRGLQ